MKGFTLVEVLVATVILTVGIVGVLGAYITSLNALQAGQESMEAVCVLKEKMAGVEQQVLEDKGISLGTSSGEFDGFEWNIEVTPGPEKVLNKVTVAVSPKEGRRKFSLVTYVENKE